MSSSSLFSWARSYGSKLPSIDLSTGDSNYTCSPHAYETVVLSQDPLVLYMRNFISEAERLHLLDASVGRFQASAVHNPGEADYLDRDVRDSVYFDIGPDDKVTSCIRQRALDFYGRWPRTRIEQSRVQRYESGGHFTHHYDAFDDESSAEVQGNRVATFMLYLEAPGAGGGTEFPNIQTDLGRDGICDIVDCATGKRNGTVLRPSEGNAVFWMNLHADKSLHLDTLHAGLPVESGVKTIMNIWLWQRWSDA